VRAGFTQSLRLLTLFSDRLHFVILPPVLLPTLWDLRSDSFVEMSLRHSDPSWFALTVRSNHEHTAERGLLNQGFEAYLPAQRVRRRWSDRTKEVEALLFPGYVFCRFVPWDRLRILNSPGVRSIVGFGRDPAPVDETEISAVRALVSSGRPISPWPYFRIGQRVVIDHGPLASLRGVVVRAKDSWRVVVSVDALSCSIAVEVDPEVLSPLWPSIIQETAS
jgi:transcription antitermination factor NusG